MGVARLARLARAGDRARRRLRHRRRRPSRRRRPELDPAARRPLPARRRRAEPVPRPADVAALGGGGPLVGPAGAGPAAQLLLHARARPDRDPGGVPRPGPAPVRPLLRPDADPVLLPDRRLGNRRPDPGDDQDDRLHAGRVAVDARRRDRHRGAQRRRDRRGHVLDRDPSAGAAAGRQPVLDLRLLRRRLPGQDAGFPRPRLDGRRLPHLPAAGARPAQRGALEGRRLWLPADRHPGLPRRLGPLPGRAPDHRRPLDPLRLGDGVHA